MKWVAVSAGILAIAFGALFVPVGGKVVKEQIVRHSVPVFDLSAWPADRPAPQLRFLFIHHSCGSHWLADPGPTKTVDGACRSCPEGGSLRRHLQEAGYEVHEASYGSAIGNDTDLFDWLPKFRSQMDQILSCDQQDAVYTDGRRNHVVAFKSCFPNNLFVDESVGASGEAAGNAAGPELTVANAKAAYLALLPEFAQQPRVLFVCITAPPVAPAVRAEPLWKWLARRVLRRPSPEQWLAGSGAAARRFNNWLKSTDGWLKDYQADNVVVFDLFDLLTEEGASNLSRYATQDGRDSHPSRAGNAKATQAFVPFLNRAVRRADRP